MRQTEKRQDQWSIPRRISWGQLCVVTPIGCLLFWIAFVLAQEGLKGESGWLATALLLGLTGFYYLFPLCWELGGKEGIVLTRSHFILYRSMGVLRWRQEILRDDIERLQVVHRKQHAYIRHYLKNWFSPNPLLGFQGGAIQIVTAKSLYAVGISLKESEAAFLLHEIQSALIQSSVPQHSNTTLK